MSTVRNTFELISRGRSGNVPKVLTNIEKLDEVIHGIKQGYYYLIGGDTGTGKTQLLRGVFIEGVYNQTLAVNDESKLDCLFIDFSLEIPSTLNLAGCISRRIYEDYPHVVIPVSKMFSWGKEMLSEDHHKIVESYQDYLEGFQKKLISIERETSPNYFHDVLMDIAKRVGKFKTEGRYIDDCDGYVLNNPNLYVMVSFDTLNLAALDSNHITVKSSIDRISKIAVRFRNKCNFTFVPIQQFNSDIATTDRARFGVQGPNLKDFMDSTGPTKDATVVLGLYSPMRYLRDDQTVWRGYDVATLKSWLISLHVLKNRYGQAGKYIPMKFAGAVGAFSQMKEAKDLTEQDYRLYTQY